MKTETLQRGHTRTNRPLRAERRAAERAKGRQQSKRGARLPLPSIIGGIATILAVVVILTFGITRANNTVKSAGLTDPNALSPSGSLLSVGQQAPDFALKDTSGKLYHLAAQRGHPVLLEFFAVWCPVCQAEAPTIAQITKEYVPRGVRVWAVLASPYGKNYDLSGQSDLSLATRDDLSWYARQFDVRHPQLIDPKFTVVNEYGVRAYPGIYVVDKKGVITHATEGRQSVGTLSRALGKALSGGSR